MKKNPFKILSYFLKTRKNNLKTILFLNNVRGTLYIIITVTNRYFLKTLISKSFKSLLLKKNIPSTSFFRRGVVLKYQLWRPFFSKFLSHLPVRSTYVWLSSWFGSIKPVLELIYAVQNVEKIFFKNKTPFTTIKLKKKRRIKKKLKKKLYK